METRCVTCKLRELCIPGDIVPGTLEQLGELVTRKKKVTRGQTLVHSGDEFDTLYAVRTGFFKSQIQVGDKHQITGFQIPGELLGLDGIAGKHYNAEVIALQDSEVCVLNYAEFEHISGAYPPLQHQLNRIMSREIVREQNTMKILGCKGADQRVAAFLLDLSERYGRLGYSYTRVILGTTREEIGSYLGLSFESVCRSLSRFQKNGTVSVMKREIDLLDIARLRKIATG